MPDLTKYGPDAADMDRDDYRVKVRRERIRRAKELAEAGATWGEFAKAEGVSRPAVHQFCTMHAPDLVDRFTSNGAESPSGARSKDEIIWILKLLAGVDRKLWKPVEVARMMKVTKSAVCVWRNRYAPDGVRDALDLYMDSEAEVRAFYRTLYSETSIEIDGDAKGKPKMVYPYGTLFRAQAIARMLMERCRNESQSYVSDESELYVLGSGNSKSPSDLARILN
jgi:predicted transcriptional regulator